MPYVLGVDIGDSFTSAAVCRRRGATWGGAETVRLGARSSAAASLIELSPTGALLTGDGVRADASGDPGRILRGFNRRVGDDVPMVVDGRSYRPQELLAALARLVVDRLHEQEGEACEQVVLAHPAGWGPHRQGLLLEALRDAGLGDVVLVPGPVAAAEHQSAGGRLPGNALLAGYDLGGTTCTTFLVGRPAHRSPELLAHTEHTIGGADLDDALLAHVRAAIGRAITDPSADVDSGPVAVLLRRDCTEARERLSDAPEAHVPLPWWAGDPGGTGEHQRAMRVTRAELETLIRPLLRASVDGLARLVAGGDHAPADVAGVLLVGGAARTPLVAELIADRLRAPVLLDEDPRTTAARGAALVARRIVSGHRGGAAPVWPHEVTAPLPLAAEESWPAGDDGRPARPPVEPATEPARDADPPVGTLVARRARRGRRRR
ncbi:Hsp70 family protein [Dactylosporangium roseum]|uniref:Hsp70 family protein n=1 Tax=Dactylosporangium roseum TaxID=47989 RepID=A0ABY5Z9U3_9ACTN|nr:Hsp70 family protein [Dactylosporangium roseum]UWZ38875.1 Hsp70 family protein [Dactylosporangium roseum]